MWDMNLASTTKFELKKLTGKMEALKLEMQTLKSDLKKLNTEQGELKPLLNISERVFNCEWEIEGLNLMKEGVGKDIYCLQNDLKRICNPEE